MTTLTIMRYLPREVDPLVYNMSHEDPGDVTYSAIGMFPLLKQEYISTESFLQVVSVNRFVNFVRLLSYLYSTLSSSSVLESHLQKAVFCMAHQELERPC